jgi:Protein of unknown function (DUF2934)
MTEPFGLFGEGGLKFQPCNRFWRGTGVAKQRIRMAPSVDRAPNNSPLEKANGIDSKQIAALAYHLWQARGCPQGSPEIDWLDAEQQIRGHLNTDTGSQVSEPILARRLGA